MRDISDCLELVSPYTVLSKYYDHYTISNKKYFAKWPKFLITNYQEIYNNLPTTLLDVACGTGKICSSIKKEYPDIEIDACDMSDAMIEHAAEKSKINYFKADMRTLSTQMKYDMAINTFDSVNYMLTIEDFIAMLASVSSCLVREGLYIFDNSTTLNSRENFDCFLNYEEKENYSLIHEAEFDSRDSLQISRFTIFQKESVHWKKSIEVHKQKIWKCNEVKEMID